jgi:hypothetical protein
VQSINIPVCIIFFVEHQRTFVTVHLISQLLPNLLHMWFVYGVLLMFIPIMGRVGDTIIPDLAIGGVSAFGVILLLTWQVIAVRLLFAFGSSPPYRYCCVMDIDVQA